MIHYRTERKYKMKYRAIDLFAGIGGIRKGFDNAFGKNIDTEILLSIYQTQVYLFHQSS